MQIKSSSTAILGMATTIFLVTPAQAHAAKNHYHYVQSGTYIGCRVVKLPFNNGHDRLYVLSCPINQNKGNGHDRDNGHDRGNGSHTK